MDRPTGYLDFLYVCAVERWSRNECCLCRPLLYIRGLLLDIFVRSWVGCCSQIICFRGEWGAVVVSYFVYA